MLLDEPSLGLAPRLVAEIATIIERLNREQGVAILLVEQNARMALDVASYGYVMEVGRIVMEDTCERLKEATDIQEFYLGMKDQGVRGRRRWKQRKDLAVNPEGPMSLYGIGTTHTGLVRAGNEDAFLIEAAGENLLLAVVADGLGGHQAGEGGERACG